MDFPRKSGKKNTQIIYQASDFYSDVSLVHLSIDRIAVPANLTVKLFYNNSKQQIFLPSELGAWKSGAIDKLDSVYNTDSKPSNCGGPR